jgi:hypothetical protein
VFGLWCSAAATAGIARSGQPPAAPSRERGRPVGAGRQPPPRSCNMHPPVVGDGRHGLPVPADVAAGPAPAPRTRPLSSSASVSSTEPRMMEPSSRGQGLDRPVTTSTAASTRKLLLSQSMPTYLPCLLSLGLLRSACTPRSQSPSPSLSPAPTDPTGRYACHHGSSKFDPISLSTPLLLR